MLTFIKLAAAVIFRKLRGLLVIHLSRRRPGFNPGPTQFKKKSAAAEDTETETEKICSLIFFSDFFPPPTKQAKIIKLVTTVGHFYATFTLQTFIWLSYLVNSFQSQVRIPYTNLPTSHAFPKNGVLLLPCSTYCSTILMYRTE